VSSLVDLTWPATAVRGAEPPTLVVPIGATEQHGPHLPLTTDTEIAVALADGLARARQDVVLAPAIPYGSSGEHADFPGTLSIGQEALEQLLVELCRSATAHFTKILLVSAHGGNAEPLARAVELLTREGRAVRAWQPRWGGDAHAGRTESSIMLALAPRRVDLTLAARGAVEPIAALLPRLRRDGVRAVSPNGVLGDPAGASAVEGRALLDDAVADLAAMLDGWKP
jgi:creatinine amidohydrolase